MEQRKRLSWHGPLSQRLLLAGLASGCGLLAVGCLLTVVHAEGTGLAVMRAGAVAGCAGVIGGAVRERAERRRAPGR